MGYTIIDNNEMLRVSFLERRFRALKILEASMKARMKENLIELYEQALPGELAAAEDREERKAFLKSIEGKEVELVFTLGDAFEKTDNNVWLPNSLWVELSNNF
jgi:hypothetical protein